MVADFDFSKYMPVFKWVVASCALANFPRWAPVTAKTSTSPPSGENISSTPVTLSEKNILLNSARAKVCDPSLFVATRLLPLTSMVSYSTAMACTVPSVVWKIRYG